MVSDLGLHIVDMLQSSVLEPDMLSALWVLTLFLVGEFVTAFPLTIILTSQIIFVEGGLSIDLITALILLVSLPVGIGTALGSLLQYGLAYVGGKPAIEKYHKYLRFSWKDVEKTESYFKNKWYDEITFLALRSIPFLPSLPINLVAGILRMRVVPYLVLTTIGTTIRTILMFAILYSLGL